MELIKESRMNKAVKISLIFIFALILVLGGTIIYLTTMFNPNDYKAEIIEAVKTQTGLDLIINGDMSLSVFPWLGVSVENIQVNSIMGPLASVSLAKASTKLMPLFDGEVQIDGLTLDDLKLTWIIDELGKTALELSSADTTTSAGSNTSSVSNVGAAASITAITVGNIFINNANIIYHDQQLNQFHQLQNLNLKIQNASLSGSFPLHGQFDYSNQPDSYLQHVNFKAQLDASNYTQKIELNNVLIEANDAQLHADALISFINEQPVINAVIKLENLQPSKFAKILNEPLLADNPIALQLGLELNLDLDKDTLMLSSLNVSSKQLNINGSLEAVAISSNPVFNGKLTLEPFNLQKLLAELNIPPIDTSDPTVLHDISANLAFKGTDNSLIVPELTLTLDDTTAEGELRIQHFDKPEVVFNLAVDTLNIDRYMAAVNTPVNSTATAAPVAAKTSPDVLLLPIALLQELNITSQLRLGKLIASGLTTTNLRLELTANNGFIEMKSLSGMLYGGQFTAKGILDVINATPKLSFTNKVSAVRLAPIVSQLADNNAFTGILNLDIQLNSEGNTQANITKNLQGDASFNISEGILKGINIDTMVCEGLALINHDIWKNDVTSPAGTAFNSLNGVVKVNNGVIAGDAINVALKNLKLKGAGYTNLVTETLDYKLTAQLHGDFENMACRVNERYRDVEWPIRCRGKFSDDPAALCGIDKAGVQDIFMQMAKKDLEKIFSNELQKLFK